MKSKNVIISLLFVLALLAYIFMKIRSEPRKKLTFNRNPSRIEYTQFALCRMDCYGVNANAIALIFRNGEVNRTKGKGTCPIFTLHTLTKQGMNIFITVQQCGTIARIVDCSNVNAAMPCNCTDKENQPILYLKVIPNAFSA